MSFVSCAVGRLEDICHAVLGRAVHAGSRRLNSTTPCGRHPQLEPLEPRLLLAAEIHGAVWNDMNADGVFDGDEPGMAGVTVYLDSDGDGVLDAGEINVMTDSNGDYAFVGLGHGDYTVAQVLQLGWRQTFPPPPPAGHAVSLNPDTIATGINFGNAYRPFTDIDAGLFSLYGSDVSWGDYDNDGDLDLALSGGWFDGSQHEMARIYRNDGAGVFTHIGPGDADGANSGSVDWGDHNNDGLLDLAVSGYAGGGHFWLRIYQNAGGDAFTKITGGFPPVEGHSLAWGDYDNDGDQDLAITGGWWDRQNVPGTKIYRNDGAGVYTDIGAAVADVSSSALAWADYDQDGDLDLALAGDSLSGRVSIIYRNDGGGTFTDIGAALTRVSGAYLAWGDYDNDGDLDLIVAGDDGVDVYTILYRNDGGGVFTDTTARIVGLTSGSVAWGDYDADGDLDLALAGYTPDGPVSRIYRSDWLVSNSAPAAPGGLAAGVFDDAVAFSWSAGVDGETPSAGLSYNLRVGTSPGGNDVFAGMADVSTGLRHTAEIGNAQQQLSWSLNGLRAPNTMKFSGSYGRSEYNPGS